ncbi:MAG: DUF58 domain-containing protein [bacterium]
MPKKNDSILLEVPDLLLRSKLILKGYLSGIHSVPYKGASAEFSQYREYVLGDDYDRIDWKAYMRSGRYYVKESDNESNTGMSFLLDASASMAFAGKFEYAKTLAFLFSYICAKQNDSFSYAVFSDKLHIYRKAGTGRKAIYDAGRDISLRTPGGETNLAPILEKIFEKIKESSFLILISDLGDNEEKLIELMARMRVKKHDSIIFHLSSRLEESREILDKESLRDIETGSLSQGGGYRERIDAIKERNKKINDLSLERGIDYNHVYVEDGFNAPLSKFFSRRNQ